MADITVTPASVVPSTSALFRECIAGATITAGQAVYIDATDGRAKLADANASSSTSNCVGIAANGASAGQYVKVVYYDPDFTVGATIAKGVYVLSGTPGGIAPVADLVAGWYPVVLMVGISTTKAIVNITRGTAAV